MSLKRFLKNTSGNVTVLMGLVILPVLLATGAGIDIARQVNIQTKMQAAADEAILAGGASKLPSAAQVKMIITDYVKANGGTDMLKSVSGFDIVVDNKAGVFSVNIKGTVDTGLMALAGYPTLNVGAYSEVAVPYQGAEIALVLDNTASMASEGRLDALKIAAKNLVQTVLSGQKAGTYVKISIIPFSDYVNVGMANRSAFWMKVPANSTTINPNVCSVSYPNAVSSNCHDAQGVWNNDGVPTPYTYQVCDTVYGNPVTTCGPQTVTTQWYGCVGSRNSPLDEGISGATLSPYPGIMNAGCTQPITDLTDKLADLNTAIDAMVASGNTYLPSGLLWGWNVLDSSDPYSTAKSKSAMAALNGTKTMVFMTDGDNTLSPGTGVDYKYHWGGDVAFANAKTAALCDGIKQDGINIYTVGFKVNNITSQALLDSCASSPAQAFNAANDAELQANFQQIASNLAHLRITK
jgi:Flp pilus assembly protein TadG